MISLNRNETIETLRKCLTHVECPCMAEGCFLAGQHDCREQLMENVVNLLEKQMTVSASGNGSAIGVVRGGLVVQKKIVKVGCGEG